MEIRPPAPRLLGQYCKSQKISRLGSPATESKTVSRLVQCLYRGNIKKKMRFSFFQELQSLGGTPMLRKYNNSRQMLFCSVYTEHDWLPWKFERISAGFWENVANQRKYLDWVASQLNIYDFSDWYKVSFKVTLPIIRNLIFPEFTRCWMWNVTEYI
jgi:hypothetical protein